MECSFYTENLNEDGKIFAGNRVEWNVSREGESKAMILIALQER